jgi:NarL family two-component system response regulator YdfI
MTEIFEVFIMAAARSRRDELVRGMRAATSIHVAGTAATFAFLRSLIDQSAADVAVIDIGAAPDSEMAREWLTEIVERLPVVLLIAAPDEEFFNAIIRAERGALLRNDASFEQIVQAIHSIHLGLLTLDGRIVPEHDGTSHRTEELTPRETEVLSLLAEGLGNREIAARLNISEHTIKFHIRSILAKLGASTRTEAVTRGLRSGLIEL